MFKRSVAAIIALAPFMQSALAHDAPTAELGCFVFDSNGKIIRPEKMSDKELLQAINCKRIDEAQTAADQQQFDKQQQRQAESSQVDSDLRDAMAQQKASTQQIREMQPAGGGAQVPYPPPGNARTVILQSQ